jgi:hypothetical protein
MPHECPPTRRDLTLLEALFDSEAMLLMGRLLIIVATVVMLACGLFALASMAVRMRHGHWLRRAGPFEVSENAMGEADQRTQALTEILIAQQAQLAAFEGALEEAKRAVSDRDRG